MEVVFFNSLVRQLLLSLQTPYAQKSFRYIKLLKYFGNQLGMPYSKQLAHNLFELRVRGQQEIRILYCFDKNQAVIVHAFIKKTQKTPPKEIAIAQQRMAILTKT